MLSFGLLLSLVSFFSFWEDFLHKRSLSKSSFTGACFSIKKKKVYRFFSADLRLKYTPFPLLNSFLCTFLLVGFMLNGARVATTRQGPLCSPPGGQGWFGRLSTQRESRVPARPLPESTLLFQTNDELPFLSPLNRLPFMRTSLAPLLQIWNPLNTPCCQVKA